MNFWHFLGNSGTYVTAFPKNTGKILEIKRTWRLGAEKWRVIPQFGVSWQFFR